MTPSGGASTSGHGPRGQPLAVLAVLLVGWTVLRWQVWPDDLELARDEQPPTASPQHRPQRLVAMPAGQAHRGTVAGPRRPRPAKPRVLPPTEAVLASVGSGVRSGAGPWPAMPAPGAAGGSRALPRTALAESGEEALASVHPAALPQAPDPVRVARWSGDGWVFLRRGAGPALFAAGTTGYGGSQAGAVLRYRIAPASPVRPTAYLRASAALPDRGRAGNDREVAAGLAVRPFSRIPVSLQAEVRLQDGGAGRRPRPAVVAVSTLPPQRLPAGLTGEFYAAAGYVGGAGPTGFYDAQATLTRPLLPVPGMAGLRAGAGVWAGGQRGVHRVDVGPRAELPLRLGPVGARFALDYRWRVAGHADPGSGAAVTLSAGF